MKSVYLDVTRGSVAVDTHSAAYRKSISVVDLGVFDVLWAVKRECYEYYQENHE